MLTEMYMKDELHVRHQDLHGLMYACTRWMHSVIEFETSKQLEIGALHTADPYSFDTYEALALLLLTLLRKPAFRNLGNQKWWRQRRVVVVGEMLKFDTSILQWIRSQWAGPLRQLASNPPYLETDEDGRPVFSDDQIQHSIQDLPEAVRSHGQDCQAHYLRRRRGRAQETTILPAPAHNRTSPRTAPPPPCPSRHLRVCQAWPTPRST